MLANMVPLASVDREVSIMGDLMKEQKGRCPEAPPPDTAYHMHGVNADSDL